MPCLQELLIFSFFSKKSQNLGRRYSAKILNGAKIRYHFQIKMYAFLFPDKSPISFFSLWFSLKTQGGILRLTGGSRDGLAASQHMLFVNQIFCLLILAWQHCKQAHFFFLPCSSLFPFPCSLDLYFDNLAGWTDQTASN